MKEITVIRAGALGDVVLTLPAIAALRSAFPAARLRAVGYLVHWAVAGDLVDEVQSIDAAAMTPLLTDSPAEPLQRALGSSDLVIAWTGHDPTPALRSIRIRHIVHTPPTPPSGVHASDWLLQSVSELLADASGHAGSSFDLAAWQLPYSEAERQQGSRLLEDLGLTGAILLHPGAGADWKRWPAARFAATGIALRSRGRQIALLEGPADSEAVAAVQRHAPQPFPVVPSMETRALGAMLSQAPCYLGNDSGVTHLAGAVGTPTVALFGPTDPATWKPLGRTIVLRHCTASSGPVAGIRVCDDPACLEAITADEAVDAVQRAIVQNRVETCR